MSVSGYTEDTLVQQTTSDFLRDTLGWETVYAYNQEDYGPDSLLGRKSQREVVLERYLDRALRTLNPGLPNSVYEDAIREIKEVSVAQSPVAINQEKHELLLNGVPVQYQNADGEQEHQRLRVFDFGNPENNHFLAVRELWIQGPFKKGRSDIVGFGV